MQHTPAPWYYSSGCCNADACVQVGDHGFPVKNEDDAKLIAASPGLYEIVHRFEDLMHCHKHAVHQLSVQLALEALAKDARVLLNWLEEGV